MFGDRNVKKDSKNSQIGKLKTVTNAIRQIARRNRLSFIPISRSLNLSLSELSEYLYSRKVADEKILLDVIVHLRKELILKQEFELRALDKLEQSLKSKNNNN